MSSGNDSSKFNLSDFKNKLTLSKRLLFTSNNLLEAQSSVGRVMTPHELHITNDFHRLDANMHYLPFDDISLYRLRYGSSVSIHIPSIQDYYCVQIPLSGRAHVVNGNDQTESNIQLASVLNPHVPTDMTWDYDNDQFMIRISRSLMERTAIGILGHDIDEPLMFDVGFHWQQSPEWFYVLSYLVDYYSQSNPSLTKNRLIISQINQLVATTLFSSHQHSYMNRSNKQRTSIRPRHIKRAQDYLEAHAHESITVEFLASLCGVSVRSLYTGFRDFVGVTPMQYLRNLRLDRIRTELLTSEAKSVTSVAMRWGFSHMGRFSAEYKRRFGESPSQSFRRR